MNFHEELKKKQLIIETRIEEIINIGSAPASIVEAMKYSLLAGGKRIRPVLVISICEALGGKMDEVLNMACALELIHTYSLIHDDLPAMDNDDLRRGKPTNHKIFGEAKAILAGDGLLNYAYEVIFNEIVKNNFDQRFVRAGQIISNSAGVSGMIGGQIIDIESQGKKTDIDILYDMHRLKTGALIGAACAIGCIIADNREKLNDVMDYSENLGLAFQIVDDILDYTGDINKLGKKIGSDRDNNKSTFVNVLGIEKSKKLAEEYSNQAERLAGNIDKSKFLSELTDFLLHRES